MPRRWPFIVINASDMSRGTPFSFVQEDFDRICSDVNGVKIARAVMASAAFPGPFTPLTFKNYPKSRCGYKTPGWVDETLAQDSDEDPEGYQWARTWKSYEDEKKRPYLHLYDGGISDNLGIRPVIFALATNTWNFLDMKNPRKNVKRLVLIAVDAKPTERRKFDRRPNPPKLASILSTAAAKPLSNYSVDTMVSVHEAFSEFEKADENYQVIVELCNQIHHSEEERKKCYGRFKAPRRGRLPPYPELYLVHVRFDKIENENLFAQLSQIATDLQLPRKEVDLVTESAGKLLEKSHEFQKLLGDLRARGK
jgi:NTE family protein